MIKKILALLSILFLVSCGDSSYFNNSEGTQLRQYVFAVPESYTGDAAFYFAPIKELLVDKGQTVKFVAGYSINDLMTTEDSTSKYYKNFVWELDGERFYSNSFRYTFSNTGTVHGSLKTVDLYDDTLVTPITVFVNAPEKVVLEFPYNGYNQAEPSTTSELPMRWKITGLEEWESATCKIHISNDIETIWENPIGETDCHDQATLWGPLLGSREWVYNNLGIDLRDSSVTFFWGIKYSIYTDGNFKAEDSTDVFHFSTKILDNKKSIVKIPIKYKGAYTDVSTEITFVSANGDTIGSLTNKYNENTISQKISPQSRVKVYLRELSLKDYGSDSLVIDVPPNTAVVTDTVVLVDNVPPQIAPSSTVQHLDSRIKFSIYDDGSGINYKKISATRDGIPLNIDVASESVYVYHACKQGMECHIKIHVEDNERNAVSGLYWDVVLDDETDEAKINGPFLAEDE